MPPKSVYVSLNLDTDVSHAYQRAEDHGQVHPDASPRVTKVLETTGPTVEHTHLDLVSKPFVKLANKTVDCVIDGNKKKIASVDGKVEYHTSRTEFEPGTGAGVGIVDGQETELGVKRHSVQSSQTPKDKRKKQESIDDIFDTSDL